jgi:uncharacterized membrane protein
VRRLRSTIQALRARPGLAAIIAVGVAWGFVMHSMGWAQMAHYAQVRAFDNGQAQIDQWHWETNDKAWVDGHFYSVKSPGVAALSLPFYEAIDAVGGKQVALQAAVNARETAHPKWKAQSLCPLENYGYSVERCLHTESRVEAEAPIVWLLTLIVAVLPAVALLIGVRWAGDRVAPGYGTAAAITLGLATIVMTFAAEYFSHVISAGLAFAGFLALWKERDGPPSWKLVAGAGLLAGLAVTFEFQTGLVGIVLFAYALSRRTDILRRAAAYAGGTLAGALPMLAFNTWAFGNPLKLAYGYAVEVPGITGHDKLGLNTHGFFGITAPRFDSAIDLLLAGRGLLVLTPIIVMCIVGVVLMHRRGRRAESNVIAAVAILYFVYNAGYWLPFGGGTPGPRFLIPALPFLAIGLACAYRRLPALTLGLAVPSAVFMLAGTLTFPLLGKQGTGTWADWVVQGNLEHTVLTAFGVSNAWLAIAPFIAAVVTAVVLAAKATPAIELGRITPAVAAVIAWAGVSVIGPTIANESPVLERGNSSALWLVLAGALLSLGTLTVIRVRERRAQSGAGAAPEPKRPLGPELALEESSS